MTTYLGALSHGLDTIALDRVGRLIRWTLIRFGTPAGVVTQHDGPPHAAHDAIEHPAPTPGPLDGQDPLIGET